MSNDAISQQTVKDKLTLRADGSGYLSWDCDTAFELWVQNHIAQIGPSYVE